MMNIQIVESKQDWETFLQIHPEANFLQSWQWGEFQKALGKTVIRTGLYKDGKLAGVFLSVVEPAKRGRYMTVAGGPILDLSDQQSFEAFVSEVSRIAKENSCVFVRVRPQLIENEISKKLFEKAGFKSAPMHLTADLTSQLDLSQDEETLLRNMRKNTRYEINKAIKEGIRIEASSDPANIKEFYDLQLETAKRHDFVPFSYEFLHEQFKAFVQNNSVLLYKAYKDNKLLAEAFIIFYGSEATYHYGASTDEGRNYPGAYLIQWEAIKEAKKRGISRYNFWGVERLDNPKHRFYGVSVFKRGFGGQDVQYLHAQDLVMNPVAYSLNYALETIRRKSRRL
ncbi:hypothetical protein A3B50_03800 [Candidatus Roizmanbacteria bacterium RIFCSPLOWO2_01_FULL_40_42]|uniref:BioF2-like acetyltransferase domain-containing protein n=1 Tax=Candidatus Roizmanbacteria bacterium RIFCSPLOWO2_01_FULL_40_42 TaxID=1802066 RepID=A0A1F7J2P5_9BACT|nr:MAG: hypothetical protein A2779_00405 [Candidatus Roizmanbacteria bacterium RIFCSPHIGHO2_01_FULL_40_98]OGK30277.1 MAG: hypothetical protein A2W49_01045 [Candidatus Roizmanbacteria bacterium RIFCSPHIGHO2_12_41_18]OGK37123.1 MAG: hypothetical protein A3E69_01550 [Candidatus Roizmanbacteria bacterium RIFCSPHIGHO2_12_FULL_40_130]OGK49883.1 MAG: hypothetical protein A3B50_03800 [Candidatus Roizmanbacteria bacterium RIFCSPLOWO2_01_FULL_40_42]